ncbi:hypothetical protein H9P43_004474 [Blastocladiella emersonii ATCC 22665]|nr:hypothetical protein H9P43_004474 [Blastocladiella emersonii ATCC 22665]
MKTLMKKQRRPADVALPRYHQRAPQLLYEPARLLVSHLESPGSRDPSPLRLLLDVSEALQELAVRARPGVTTGQAELAARLHALGETDPPLAFEAMVEVRSPASTRKYTARKWLATPAGFPSKDAAVVGGNVMTSQRVVDVILRAFNYCAASQGDCNNLTFGNDSFGYYETIAGGAGAGPGWHGRSGVHTHMTNTRITDPEILERRYPVVLRQFSLRKGSGGAGKWRGGDGVVRELEFTVPLQVSVLTERRVHSPYGLAGGHSGEPGRNLLIKGGGDGGKRTINLGGKCTVKRLILR